MISRLFRFTVDTTTHSDTVRAVMGRKYFDNDFGSLVGRCRIACTDFQHEPLERPTKTHLCHKATRMGEYLLIRMSLGGVQSTVGASDKYASAARYADMAMRHFNGRCGKNYTEEHLNCSLVQLDLDWEHEDVARRMLKNFDDYYVKTGRIISASERINQLAEAEGGFNNKMDELKALVPEDILKEYQDRRIVTTDRVESWKRQIASEKVQSAAADYALFEKCPTLREYVLECDRVNRLAEKVTSKLL